MILRWISPKNALIDVVFPSLIHNHFSGFFPGLNRTMEASCRTTPVEVLINRLRNGDECTLNATLTLHHSVTYDLLCAVMLPGVTPVAAHPVTDGPRAIQLV